MLFCDLVGFTARSDQADPEDVRAAIAPYHTLLREEIERFGGTVEKFIGDAVMAVFGAPIAHEDDAERAVRAALRILEAIEELNDRRPELPLSVRIGINTGEAVVSLGARPERGEGIVTGDVVNTASRLQSVAPQGGIAVGDITRRTTGHVIDYEALDPVQVKGKAEALTMWRALGTTSRQGVDLPEGATTPFLGREFEMALLQGTFGRALKESSVQLITITGEPGVGKSRLLGEFYRFVEQRPELVIWRQGRCLPYGDGVSFWALGEVLKAHAGILETDDQATAGAKLDRVIGAQTAVVGDAAWLRASLAPLVGLGDGASGQTERAESFAAWRRFLEGVAEQAPFVLVFEDLHWADGSLLEFIDELVERASGVPLLVIATARPEHVERHPGWGAGKRNAATLALGPLDDEEISRLIASVLSRSVMPAELQAALLERAGGNPLYAGEFARMLRDSPERTLGTDLPESIQALIAARLDTLGPRKSLLQDAAVMGKVFWAGAVAAMGGVEESVVRESLHELARREFVRPARASSFADQSEHSFLHVLTRDIAYAQIPRAERARKHLAAATWIEEQAGDRVADYAEILAHHYLETLRLYGASGSAPHEEGSRRVDVEARARRVLMTAAGRLVYIDPVRADALYQQVLDIMPDDPVEQAEVYVAAGMCAHFAGRLDDAAERYTTASTLLRGRGRGEIEGVCLKWMANSLWLLGSPPAQIDALQAEALRMLEAEAPGEELAGLYTDIGWGALMRGSPQEALTWSNKGLDLAERLDLWPPRLQALVNRANIRIDIGDRRASEDIRAAIDAAVTRGIGFLAAFGYSNLPEVMWIVEGPVAAVDALEEAVAYLEPRGFGKWIASARTWALPALFQLGDWGRLISEADGIMGSPNTDRYMVLFAKVQRAAVLIRKGERGIGTADLRETTEAVLAIEDRQLVVPALALEALAAHAAGDTAEVLRWVEEFDRVSAASAPRYRLHYLADLVRLCVSAGDQPRARHLLTGLVPMWPREHHLASAAEAMVEEAWGDLDQAVRGYREAADHWAAHPFPWEQAQCLFGTARCLARLGRSHEAELAEARSIFLGLQARPSVAACDEWSAGDVARSS